jgi:hypothetical protein
MTREEFDSLAIFVAVVEELRREPFFSEDNHDRLTTFNSGSAENASAFFCHPAFLKSAVLPFRKIWMSSERCAFLKRSGTKGIGIRDLVFREHPDKKLTDGYRYWFYESFECKLKQQAHWSHKSNNEIVSIWINTQVAHTGPKNPKNKQSWEFELADFDQWATQIGREKFEFLFRSGLQTIGSTYVGFAEKLAIPLFDDLRKQGRVPGFEAEMALKYNPYPDQRYQIKFDDLFWHLDRESLEETFDRLLARQRFESLHGFLRGLVPSKSEALAAVCHFEQFGAFLKGCNATILDRDSKIDGNLLLRSGPPGFEAYEGRAVRFKDDSEDALRRVYSEFRTRLFEERKRQESQRKCDEW